MPFNARSAGLIKQGLIPGWWTKIPYTLGLKIQNLNRSNIVTNSTKTLKIIHIKKKSKKKKKKRNQIKSEKPGARVSEQQSQKFQDCNICTAHYVQTRPSVKLQSCSKCIILLYFMYLKMVSSLKKKERNWLRKLLLKCGKEPSK